MVLTRTIRGCRLITEYGSFEGDTFESCKAMAALAADKCRRQMQRQEELRELAREIQREELAMREAQR